MRGTKYNHIPFLALPLLSDWLLSRNLSVIVLRKEGMGSVISDWPLPKHYFIRGFIYVQNTPQEIAEGITKLIGERATLTEDMLALRQELSTRRKPAFEKLIR